MLQKPQDLNTAITCADNADNVICFSRAISSHSGGGGARR